MEQSKHIHFIGIGGIGISGLARLYLHEGWQVSGSDAVKSANTEALAAAGAHVVYEQVATNITPDIDLVVYTEAMAEDQPEILAARASGARMINYFEALGEIANQYYLIAVAGTHGKTTTTAMLIDILEEASFDPSAIVGSLRSKTGSNYRAGKSKYFIVEACEYKRDFLHLKPDVLVITNLEHEHVDYYKDLADVQAAFRELAAVVPEDGAVIANVTDPNVAPVLEGLECTVIDYRPDISLTLNLKQPGIHNRQNAAAATAAARFLGVEAGTISAALENFAGAWRRFEYKGDVNNAPVYDDYAHHPTEIAAAIAGAREQYPERELVVVFQPHTYSRTQALFSDFVSVLRKADHTILLPIYAAREVDDGTVSSEGLVEAINQAGGDAEYFATIDAAALQVREMATPDMVVLTVGAGTVTQVAAILTESV